MSKNILVTGASSGIGEATARYLSSQGYFLVLTARNEEKLKQIAEELPNECLIYPYDLQDLEHIEEIFIFCENHKIKLDGLVHCAGISARLQLQTLTIDALRRTMDINYCSFIELSNNFVKRKYSNDGGSIVAMSSLAPFTCYAGTVNYAGTKGALNVAIRVLAKESGRRKIRVNGVAPAIAQTPLTTNAEDFRKIETMQPMGFIEIEQIAYMIEFLLSDKAKYISGSIIPISAGMAYSERG